MGIFIQKYEYKGKTSYRPHFYAHYKQHGKTKTVKLCKIRGNPPKSLSMKETGDAAYERSRQQALDMLDKHLDDVRGRRDVLTLINEAINSQQGYNSMETKVADLKSLNANRRRIKQPSKHERDFQARIFDEFTEFAKSKKKTYLWEIDENIADDYFDNIHKTLAWTSVSKRVFALSGAFKRFAPQQKNPFLSLGRSVKEGRKEFPQTPHRPLTQEQLHKLINVTQKHEYLGPVIMLMSYCGLRLGDACTLRWSDCLLEKKLIRRKLNKTGVEVVIPIFPEVEAMLMEALANRKNSDEFVLPEAAARYSSTNPNMSIAVKKVMAIALFADEPEDALPLIRHAPATVSKVQTLLEQTAFPERKKERILDVYQRFLDGQSYRAIQRETKHSRGQISGDLATVETLTNIRVRPAKKKVALCDLLEKTRVKGSSGRNKRSLYSAHSLRATFVCLSLMRGVPIELVQRIVGHTTLEMTLKYFNPTDEHVAELFATTVKKERLLGWGKANSDVANSSNAVAAALAESLTPEQKVALKQLL